MWGTKLDSPGKGQLRRHPDRSPLDPAVPAGHHLRVSQGHQAQQEPSHRRFELPRDGHGLEELVPQTVKDADIEPAEARAEQSQPHVQRQIPQSLEGQIGQAEDRLRGDEQGERRIGHDRAGQAGKQRRRFEGRGGIENFAGEQSAPQRRPEDGSDSRGGAGQHEDSPFARRQLEHPGQIGSEPRADLGDRALLPGRSSGADGDDRGHRLDQRDSRPDHASSQMEGPDHGVGPMPLGLRRPGEDQDARYQTPHCRHQQDQPPGPRVRDGMRLTFERGRHVKMEQAPEHVAGTWPEGRAGMPRRPVRR